MDSVRKAYQQAVVMPLSNVEQIWSEYNHWEQNLNKLTVSPDLCLHLVVEKSHFNAIAMISSRLEMLAETRLAQETSMRLFALIVRKRSLSIALCRDVV